MQLETFSTDKLCRWYLIHSYIYYVLNNNVIEDSVFDRITVLLQQREIPEKWKKFVSKDSLIQGTGYNIDFKKLPLILRNVSIKLSKGEL